MKPNIYTFRADSVQEALQLVRSQLGSEAAVVSTRPIRKWGIWATGAVEVQATRDVPVRSRLAHATDDASMASRRAQADQRVAAVAKELPPVSPGAASGMASSMDRAVRPDSTQQHDGLGPRPQASQDHDAADDLQAAADARSMSRSPVVTELMMDLLEHGVDAQVAKQLVSDALQGCGPEQRRDPWLVQVAVHQTLARKLRTGGAIASPAGEAQIVALVGPTGVGKTTTLAKIAAAARYDMGARVAFLSLDTFRLGAIDQLRQYAELISAPLEVASTPDEVRTAIERLRMYDLVLIDTAGRAPRDERQLRLLRNLLQAAGPVTVQLVLSACNTVAHARQSMERFAVVGPEHMIVTKLDEAVRFGGWMEWLIGHPLPISYVTVGQRVPEDMAVATPRRLSRELMGLDQYTTHREVASSAE